MRHGTGVALLATVSLASACSGASPPPPVGAKPAKPVASVAALATEPRVPPPPLHRFGSFPEDEEVQLFALKGAPLLRVGARIYSLRADEAKREPGLERVLFDDAGKPWWNVLAGAYPGELFADRSVPGASPGDWPRVEVVRVAEGATRALGTLQQASGITHRLVPLPDGRVLVTAQQGDDFLSEIVPAAPDDGTILRPCVFYGEAARTRDGSVALPCSDRRGGRDSLLTLRRGAVPTFEPMVGIDESSYSDLFTSPGGALYASSHWGGGIYARRGGGWATVEPGAAGSEAEALRLHLERGRPGGRSLVALTLHGRHLEVPTYGFAHDPEGGVWALAESGLGLFHDSAPERVVELAPSRKPTEPIATNLPVAATATASKPDAPLVEVLDATRYLPESEGEGGGGGAVRIHPLVGRTFVTIDDQLLFIDGDTLRSDPALQRGLGDRADHGWGHEVFGSIGGRFPESAWLPVTNLGERGNVVKLLRWTQNGWTRALAHGEQGKADRVYPLAHGWSILQSLAGGYAYRYGPGLNLSLLHNDVASKVVGAGLEGTGGRAEPRAVATLDDGTLFVGFVDRVAAWSPDGTPLPVPPIPPATTPYGLVARSSGEVYLLLHPSRAPAPRAPAGDVMDAVVAEATPSPAEQRILRHDGKAWLTETLPAHTARMEQLLLGPRGSLWVTLEKSPDVLVRSASGAWSTMRVPAHLDTIWAGPAGDVWAVAGAKLLHTRPMPPGFDLAAVLPPRGIQQWGPYCGSVSVLVHDVPRTARKDVSFAATIELLRPSLGALAEDAAYYEIITSNGRRSFVVHLEARHGSPSSWTDGAVARADALIEAAEAKIPGAKPRLVCLRSLGQKILPRGVAAFRAVGGTAAPPAASR